jgi:hypothetical protein
MKFRTKRSVFTRIAAIGLALVTGIAATAQLSINNVPLSKTGLSAKSLFASNETADVSSKAARENWFKIPNGYYARFTIDGGDQMEYYDKKGNKLYTIRNYDETRLPSDVRYNVKSTYVDYDIRLVQEIESASGAITYLIHLEGKAKWINVRISNGEMDEFEKYNKAK